MPNFTLTDHCRKDFVVFAQFIGQPLQSLARDQCLFDGTSDEQDDGSLEIRFANNGVITLGIGNDGESVTAKAEPLTIQEPFTLGDGSQCEWQRLELTATEQWSRLHARPLSRVEAMVEEWVLDKQTRRHVAGWLLWFGDDFVGYYNFGDNGKVLFNERAPILDDCTATFERVAPDSAGAEVT